MTFFIVRHDITKLNVDAIVNAANTSLAPGGGVCGAIFNSAGFEEMDAACKALAPIQVGEAVITPGFKLPAKYVIHTAGPIYDPKKRAECEEQLRKAYRNSLQTAVANNCRRVAFPLISSGIYGYPKEEALAVARDEIDRFLEENDLDVTLVVFDKASFKVSQKLFGEVQEFIKTRLMPIHQRWINLGDWGSYSRMVKEEPFEADSAPESESGLAFESERAYAGLDEDFSRKAPIRKLESLDLEKFVRNRDETFSNALLRLIDERDLKDSTVYKRANLDRKLFSKIRTNSDYRPTKSTVIALAIALKLSLPETQSFLQKAGFALSRSQIFDVIIEYFITHAKYDIFEINEILFAYNQPLLGQRI